MSSDDGHDVNPADRRYSMVDMMDDEKLSLLEAVREATSFLGHILISFYRNNCWTFKFTKRRQYVSCD